MKVLLLGCGNLGRALLTTWAPQKILAEILVVQPSMTCAPAFSQYKQITFMPRYDKKETGYRFDLMVLAIKPQMLAAVIPEYVNDFKDTIIVSLLTGIKSAALSSYFGDSAKVVRLMPNLAMSVGKSVNLAFAVPAVSRFDQDSVQTIFAQTGKMVWLQREELIDSLTPILGSGPAYFFLLAEILVKEAMVLGLEETAARELVQQTLFGSALLSEKQLDFVALQGAVASKGGSTEAALKVLNPNLPLLMHEALQAAAKRVVELSNLKCS